MQSTNLSPFRLKAEIKRNWKVYLRQRSIFMISMIPKKKIDGKMKLHFLDIWLFGLIALKSLTLLECVLLNSHLM